MGRENEQVMCSELSQEIYHQFFFNVKQSVLAKFKHGSGLNMLFQYLDNQKKNEFFEKVQATGEEFAQNLDWLLNIYENVGVGEAIS